MFNIKLLLGVLLILGGIAIVVLVTSSNAPPLKQKSLIPQSDNTQKTGGRPFALYTRVTEKTWPQLRPFSQEGDLYWGKVDDVPTNMRALTIPHYRGLIARTGKSELDAYAAINLDGEYKDFEEAYQDAQMIRTYVDSYNQRSKNTGRLPLKFVAFYHLNIIDAYPQIVQFPDVVMVGKAAWNADTIMQESAPYMQRIKDAKKTPSILLSTIKKERGTREQSTYSSEEVFAHFEKCIASPPKGVGLSIVGFCYDQDDSATLLQTLRAY